MAILLALLSALSYGTSDFSAGLASRRWTPEAVSGCTVATEVAFAVVGTIVYGGHGPTVHALAWGAVSGLGGGTGTIALYRGFAAGAMTVVGTLSGVVAAVVPVIVGLALGDHLGPGAAIGIGIAIPAIALVSWQPASGDRAATRSAAAYGLLAGLGFALLFVGLQRAGTRAGAWPILPGQCTGLCVVAPFAVGAMRRAGRPGLGDGLLVVAAGVLGGGAALLFLVSTGKGELSIVAVFASLYPAFTVLLARVFVGERWSRLQGTGLLIAGASVVLVSVS
jgi:drug/metabolite transporter (DMT)-like permease